MARMVTVLTQGYADWETALLAATARSHFGVDTLWATPGGTKVTSAGGLAVTPDLAVEDIDPKSFDVVVLNGGTAWEHEIAEVTDLLVRARQEAVPVAGICGAVTAMARAGLLDDRDHTGNDASELDSTNYAGGKRYRATAAALTDRDTVTAPGTAPVSFMAAVLGLLGQGSDHLQSYVGMFGAEHAPR